jgi:hypothetical protein
MPFQSQESLTTSIRRQPGVPFFIRRFGSSVQHFSIRAFGFPGEPFKVVGEASEYSRRFRIADFVGEAATFFLNLLERFSVLSHAPASIKQAPIIAASERRLH